MMQNREFSCRLPRTAGKQLGRQLISLAGLLLASSVAAQSPVLPTPENIPEAQTVNAEEFIELIGKTPGIKVIDARVTKDRVHGFIEGSVSLPDLDTSCNALTEIIPEKNSPVAFLCNGIRCGRSVRAIKIAHLCGYRNMYWFRGGFDEWTAKGYPVLKE